MKIGGHGGENAEKGGSPHDFQNNVPKLIYKMRKTGEMVKKTKKKAVAGSTIVTMGRLSREFGKTSAIKNTRDWSWRGKKEKCLLERSQGDELGDAQEGERPGGAAMQIDTGEKRQRKKRHLGPLEQGENFG